MDSRSETFNFKEIGLALLKIPSLYMQFAVMIISFYNMRHKLKTSITIIINVDD